MPGVVELPPWSRRRVAKAVAPVLAYLLLALGLGALAGVVWWLAVDLPGYQVNSEGGAVTSERGLTQFIAADAWFTVIGAVVGVILGTLAWRALRRLGWPLVLLVLLAAFASALMCWWVGFRLGPGNFAQRLAAAEAGQMVDIQLTLRARASLLVWPFAASIPVLLGSSLGRDDEEPGKLFRTAGSGARSGGTPVGGPANVIAPPPGPLFGPPSWRLPRRGNSPSLSRVQSDSTGSRSGATPDWRPGAESGRVSTSGLGSDPGPPRQSSAADESGPTRETGPAREIGQG